MADECMRTFVRRLRRAVRDRLRALPACRRAVTRHPRDDGGLRAALVGSSKANIEQAALTRPTTISGTQMTMRRAACAAAVSCLLAAAVSAPAQPVDNFYEGKTITMV